MDCVESDIMFELLMKLKEIRDKIDETSCEIRTNNIDKARDILQATEDIKHARYYLTRAIDRLIFINGWENEK